MAILEGGEIGFDEGGVLEALRDPVYTKTTTVTKYRHNTKGLVTSEKTTVKTLNITGAHVVAASLGPALLGLFIVTKGLPDDVKEALFFGSPVWMAAKISDALEGEDEEGVPKTTATAGSISDWIKRLSGFDLLF